MADLAFLRQDLDAVAAYFAGRPDRAVSEWHITHNTFHRTQETRAQTQAALQSHGLWTSYEDEVDGDRPFWLDLMERVPPDAAVVAERIARVVDVLGKNDGEYNSFTLIGSRGESWPE
jgi:hypothetical protein